jgi:glycosyltransferase involved in cell wall biosynthesis
MTPPELSVVIAAHNPSRERLRRTLAGLRAQTLGAGLWETVLVDNASRAFPPESDYSELRPTNLRLVREGVLGLSAARLRGFAEAKGELIVLVDDDNVLAPDYLERALRLAAEHGHVGAFGGKSLPEFERPPADWQREFLPLLALRDPGREPIVSRGLRPEGNARDQYPAAAAPIGAGMAIRRRAAAAWSAEKGHAALPDRRGAELSSSGDNDIVLTIMRHGWEVAYFPELTLVHLIPAARLETSYLCRLNRGIQRSWMLALSRHDANPWPPIPGWSVPLRKLKAWFSHRAWAGPAARVRWHGACGHFEGRVQSPPPIP